MDMTDPTHTRNLPSEQSSQPRSSTESSRTAEIAAILSRLALHYWRPDFDASQTKHLLADFLEDLRGIPVQDIDYATKVYRRDPENQFFPTPGKLLAILKPARKADPSYDARAQDSYRAPQLGHDFKQATKSVADVLREHGYEAQAAKWRPL